MAPGAASAQSAQEPTVIRVGVPDHLSLGQRATIQALLADGQGKPIAKATIYFTTPSTFLGGSGDMVVAEAITNKDGQAVAQYETNVEGPSTLQAEFRGDDRYAPSKATAQINVVGDAQLYVEHAGADAPPVPAPASIQLPGYDPSSVVQSFWPSLNGWPIATALIVVWSLYLLVVILIFRIAAAGRQSDVSGNAETGGSHD
jgi:hypothetical protein